MNIFNIRMDDSQRLRVIAALEMLDAADPVPTDNDLDEDTLFGVRVLKSMFVDAEPGRNMINAFIL